MTKILSPYTGPNYLTKNEKLILPYVPKDWTNILGIKLIMEDNSAPAPVNQAFSLALNRLAHKGHVERRRVNDKKIYWRKLYVKQD